MFQLVSNKWEYHNSFTVTDCWPGEYRVLDLSRVTKCLPSLRSTCARVEACTIILQNYYYPACGDHVTLYLDQMAKWGKTMNTINTDNFPTCLAPPYWTRYTHTHTFPHPHPHINILIGAHPTHYWRTCSIQPRLDGVLSWISIGGSSPWKLRANNSPENWQLHSLRSLTNTLHMLHT